MLSKTSFTHLTGQRGFHLQGEGDEVLLVFGGLSDGIDLPVFEFARVLRDWPGRVVFLRDGGQAWYHDGVVGLGAGLPGALAGLRGLIGPYRRLFCLGNSMGGFAALLFGAWLKADGVLAIAPQSFIGPWLRLCHRDGRWGGQVRRLHRRHLWRPHVFDLRPLPLPPGRILCAADEPLDRLHAARLARPGLAVETVATGGHRLVRQLREDGRLSDLLAELRSGG